MLLQTKSESSAQTGPIPLPQPAYVGNVYDPNDPLPAQPVDIGSVYKLNALLVKYRYPSSTTPTIHTSPVGTRGSKNKWYVVTIGRVVGIFNEW